MRVAASPKSSLMLACRARKSRSMRGSTGPSRKIESTPVLPGQPESSGRGSTGSPGTVWIVADRGSQTSVDPECPVTHVTKSSKPEFPTEAGAKLSPRELGNVVGYWQNNGACLIGTAIVVELQSRNYPYSPGRLLGRAAWSDSRLGGLRLDGARLLQLRIQF